MILAWTGDELSCWQAQNRVTFDFEVKFDLEGQDQSPPKTIGIWTKVFYTYGPNLVIQAWTGDELSRRQASNYRTHGRTHRQTQATTIPEGQNWPRVKMSDVYVTNWLWRKVPNPDFGNKIIEFDNMLTLFWNLPGSAVEIPA